jgi:signal transduction histidine kinase
MARAGTTQRHEALLSDVCHELRTPLTSIRSFAEILRDTPDLDADQRAQFLGIIVRESERLTRLIADLLDLARMQAGELPWRFVPVALEAVLREAAAVTGPLFGTRGVTLTLELEGGLPPLRADADRITQVAINLLANAAKFAPEGNGQVRLLLSGVVGGQAFEVADNGPGIAPADQAVIFERFRQVGKTAGSGLGLAISQAIVAGHGGTLSLRSVPGEGACFSVVLPG